MFQVGRLSSFPPSCQHPERITHYAQYTNELDFTDIPFQMKVDLCQPDPHESSTIKLAIHTTSWFTYKVVGQTDDLTGDHVTYRGGNAAEVFAEDMERLEEKLVNML